MRVLDLSLRYLSYMGIDADDSSFAIKCRYVFTLVGAAFSLLFSVLIHSIVHIIRGESSASAFIGVSGGMSVTVSFITYARKAKSIKYLCNEFQTIADRGKASLEEYLKRE